MHKLISKIFVFIFITANAIVIQTSVADDSYNQTQQKNKRIHVVNQRDPMCSQITDIFRIYSKLLSSSNAISTERMQAFLDGGSLSLQECNNLAQNVFLRPKGSERMSDAARIHYEKINQSLSSEQKELVLKAFEQMGDISAVTPQYKKYDYIVILGSTIPNMRDRIMFLAGLFKKEQLVPTDKTKVVILTGDRQLFKSETEQVLVDPAPYKQNPKWVQPAVIPTNENNSAEWVYNQLDLPDQMYNLPVKFISSDKREDQPRAQTSDTIKKWATELLSNSESHSKPIRVLIVSSNPFVYYGTLTTALTLQEMGIDSDYELEGVGDAAEPEKYPINFALGILLDNLARIIYTQHKISELNK